MKIKRNCINASVNRIDTSSKGLLIEFRNDGMINPQKLINWIKNSVYSVKVRKDQKIFISKSWESIEDRLQIVEEVSYNLSHILD